MKLSILLVFLAVFFCFSFQNYVSAQKDSQKSVPRTSVNSNQDIAETLFHPNPVARFVEYYRQSGEPKQKEVKVATDEEEREIQWDKIAYSIVKYNGIKRIIEWYDKDGNRVTAYSLRPSK